MVLYHHIILLQDGPITTLTYMYCRMVLLSHRPIVGWSYHHIDLLRDGPISPHRSIAGVSYYNIALLPDGHITIHYKTYVTGLETCHP